MVQAGKVLLLEVGSTVARVLSLAARARSSALSYLLLDANLSSPAAAAKAIKMQGIPACCGSGREVAKAIQAGRSNNISVTTPNQEEA